MVKGKFTVYGFIRGCLCLTLKVPVLLMLLPVIAIVFVPALLMIMVKSRDWEYYKENVQVFVSMVRDSVLNLFTKTLRGESENK